MGEDERRALKRRGARHRSARVWPRSRKQLNHTSLYEARHRLVPGLLLKPTAPGLPKVAVTPGRRVGYAPCSRAHAV